MIYGLLITFIITRSIFGSIHEFALMYDHSAKCYWITRSSYILILALPSGQAIKTQQNWIEFASLSNCITFCLPRICTPKKGEQNKIHLCESIWDIPTHRSSTIMGKSKTNALVGSFFSQFFSTTYPTLFSLQAWTRERMNHQKSTPQIENLLAGR